MAMQIFGVILIILIIVGLYVIYKFRKRLPKTETFKTRIEKGKDIFKE